MHALSCNYMHTRSPDCLTYAPTVVPRALVAHIDVHVRPRTWHKLAHIQARAPVQIRANQDFRLFYSCANDFTVGVAVRIDRISRILTVLSMRRRSCRQALIAHIDVHIWLRT